MRHRLSMVACILAGVSLAGLVVTTGMVLVSASQGREAAAVQWSWKAVLFGALLGWAASQAWEY
jgi:hypothetical protein